jgi:predicted CopG family antitoxin
MSKTTISATKTIRISNELYDDLAKQGRFGESFNHVLKRILKERQKVGDVT